MSKIQMSRRESLIGISSMALIPAIVSGGLAKAATADAAADPRSTFSNTDGKISSNHGHQVTLTAEQLQSETLIQLSIKGGSTHDHVLELSPSNFAELRAGKTVVVKTATTLGHAHSIEFVPTFGFEGAVGDNHGHRAYLSPEAFVLKLRIVGESDHDHSIELTVEELLAIERGEKVIKESNATFEHTHSVEFN